MYLPRVSWAWSCRLITVCRSLRPFISDEVLANTENVKYKYT